MPDKMSAFAHAMLDQLQPPNLKVVFQMLLLDGHRINGACRECPCSDFLELRPEEKAMVRSCISGRPDPSVLDIGSGIGRHCSFIRTLAPQAKITIVEINEQLRDYCISEIPECAGYCEFADVPDNARFDTVLLMGNGLGIFGTEATTREQLQRIRRLLTLGGSVLIESGNPFGGDFYEATHEIQYRGTVDGPFKWGYATHDWLLRELTECAFAEVCSTASSQGGPFFIVHAKANSGTRNPK